MAVWFGEQLREVVLSAKCCYGPSPSVCWSFYKTGNYISRKWWDKWTGRVKLCIPGKQAKHTRLYSHRLQASRWRMQGYILTDSRQAGEACKAIFSPTQASRWSMQGYILTTLRQAGKACKAIFSLTPGKQAKHARLYSHLLLPSKWEH